MVRISVWYGALVALILAAAPAAAIGALGTDVSYSDGTLTWDVGTADGVAPPESEGAREGSLTIFGEDGPFGSPPDESCDDACGSPSGGGSSSSSGSQSSSSSSSSGGSSSGSGGLGSSLVGAARDRASSTAEAVGAFVQATADLLPRPGDLPEVPSLTLPLGPPGTGDGPAQKAAPAQAGSSLAPASEASAAVSPGVLAAVAAVAGVAAVGAAAGAFTPLWARLKEWGILALAPLYTRLTRSDVLDNGTRDALYHRIQASPGITLTDLTAAGPVARNAVVHHLRILESQGFIVSRRVGRSRHFYPNGHAPSAREVVAQSTLENATTRAIADRVRAAPGTAQRDLCEGLGISPSLAHWHLARLEDAGLVRKARSGRLVQYYWSAESVILPPAPAR